MKVRELLTGPEKWTKGADARSESGYSVEPDSKAACRWCLYGAINAAYPRTDDAIRALKLVNAKLGESRGICNWNDAPERTFDDVRKLVEELDI